MPLLPRDHMLLCLSSLQQKQQELERVEKWLKMVKKWDKYKNSEKVNSRPTTHQQSDTNMPLLPFFFIHRNVMYYFCFCL